MGDRAEWPVFKGKFKGLLIIKDLYDSLGEDQRKTIKFLLAAEGGGGGDTEAEGNDDEDKVVDAIMDELDGGTPFQTLRSRAARRKERKRQEKREQLETAKKHEAKVAARADDAK